MSLLQEPTTYSPLFPAPKRKRCKAGTSRPGKRKEPPSGPGTPERKPKRRRANGWIEEAPFNPHNVTGICKVGQALTENELQSAKYINEMMSHGVRDYATGWLLQDTAMTLWYADRMGLIQSESFDIFKEPHLLLLTVAALSRADHSKLGFCPLLTFSSCSKKFTNYNGVTLDLPHALDHEARKLPRLTFAIVPNSAVQTDLGTIGRGTTIIPVRPTGRETVELFGKQRLIAKFAWPVVTRHGEDRFIRKIRRKLAEKKPAYLKHVVDLKCSLARSVEQLELPRTFMEDLPVLQNFEKRRLLCLVMEVYYPLESVKNINEFKTVFVDVVKGEQ